jgi:hypothetical protein
MLPAIRFKLLFGPYKMPRCKIGGTLKCRRRGKVRVVAISDAADLVADDTQQEWHG